MLWNIVGAHLAMGPPFPTSLGGRPPVTIKQFGVVLAFKGGKYSFAKVGADEGTIAGECMLGAARTFVRNYMRHTHTQISASVHVHHPSLTPVSLPYQGMSIARILRPSVGRLQGNSGR